MMLKNWWHMIKASWFQAISGILIISFLLFFWNILLLVSHQVAVSADQVQKKLWVYFYLSEGGKAKDEVYALVIDMIDEMKQKWLDVTFYSKEDAFDVLEKKLPNVIGNLQQYGIQNPLPPTLYVLFDNQEEYDALKKIVLDYESIIINLDDTLWWLSFSQQERRVAQVINMMNSFQYLLYFLIAIIILIIISFLLYAIRLNFFRFQKQIEVEKLLGAPYGHIMSPFLFYIIFTLFIAFWLNFSYLWGILLWLNTYFLDVFSKSIYTILPAKILLIQWSGMEIAVVFILSVCFASVVLWRLLRRV